MTPEDVVRLYIKERMYQKDAFGDYKNVKSLSMPSFLVFLKEYIDRAIKAYTGPWQSIENKPSWLENAIELDYDNTTPSEVYANLIKIMALSGAALEAYSQINIEQWRKNAEEDLEKWRIQKHDE